MNWRNASPDRYQLLRAYAKENRSHPTEAESALWSQLRGGSIGHKFLRQFIIGDVIVDFYCRDALLIIEVDGGYHAERQQQDDDFVREQYLISLGYKIIRFTNEEVLCDTDKVIAKISQCINTTLPKIRM